MGLQVSVNGGTSWLVPGPFLVGGGTPVRSVVGGYPSQACSQRVCLDRTEGTALDRTGDYPPIGGVGGSPLAVTQEDFLITVNVTKSMNSLLQLIKGYH